METPLVIQKHTSEPDYLPVKSLKDVMFVLRTETVKIWRVALPMALLALFQLLMDSSTSIYAGHIGDIELSSIGVYQGVIGAIYFYLLFGMSSALATLCGQAFGAGKIQSTCIYVQRSWIILTATCIILLPIYVYATPILKLLGQDEGIAEVAGRYSIQVIPYMFSFAVAFPIQRFLQAQSKVKVIMCIAFVDLLIQNGLLYIFINVFGWGITGLAIVTNIVGWLYAVALVVYTIGWCKEEWSGFCWMAFRDLWAFAKLSLASSVMNCLEQWYITCIMLLAGLLDNPVIAVGSYSICFNVQGWDDMLRLGINTAISVRVSNTLGMSHPRAAIYSFCVTMFQSLLLGILFMTVIFFSKDEFAKIFTDSEDMILAAADLAYLLGVTIVLNSASQVMSGVAIGSGWQVMVGYINLACYYIVGLPIGIFLGFKLHLGVKGLWGGTMCGSILQTLVLFTIIWKTNWSKEVLMDSSTSIYAGHIGDIELSSIAVYQGVINSIYFYLLLQCSGLGLHAAPWNKYSHKEVYSKHFSLKRSVKGRTPQMETPLVIQKFTSESDYLPVKSLKDLKFVLWTETVKIWRIAFPMALSALLQFLTISSTSIYAGHLGDIELSSISVYQGVISAIYFDLLFGMSSALVTLCGQAFGAGQIQSTCIYVQRSWIILTATCIILLPIYVCATPILKFIGQDHEIADLAGRYSIQVIPYMFSCAITFPFQTFLQAQIKVKVITCIALAVLVIQNVLLYIFINVFGWGTTGLAMVTNITGWVYAMALVVYTIGWCKEEWTGFSWMAFRDLWSFAKLSLASSVMSCLEQWYGTCIILLAGLLDNPVIDGWHTMLLLGISVAISIRVSNTLGMSHPRAAIYSFCVTMFQSLLLGIVFMIAIFLSKDEFAKIFTDSEDMIRAVADLAYLLGVSMVINSASQVMSGVAVGSGWQVMVGYINLACYYVVGLPIGIFLGFNQHLGVKGLWGGTMCGRILQMLVLLIIIWKTNWSKEVEQTAHRMRIWSINNLHSNDMGNVT
ncbi:Protein DETOXIFICATION 34 [Glycine max]|nr:Protein DETOXIFICATION 34 [Glycine max]